MKWNGTSWKGGENGANGEQRRQELMHLAFDICNKFWLLVFPFTAAYIALRVRTRCFSDFHNSQVAEKLTGVDHIQTKMIIIGIFELPLVNLCYSGWKFYLQKLHIIRCSFENEMNWNGNCKLHKNNFRSRMI